jgi:hypothetical protein
MRSRVRSWYSMGCGMLRAGNGACLRALAWRRVWVRWKRSLIDSLQPDQDAASLASLAKRSHWLRSD